MKSFKQQQKMTNVEQSFKSSTNKTTIMQQDRCSIIMNETHEHQDSPPSNENASHLKRCTPILFSTNRGLHLRVATTTTTLTPPTTTLMSTNNTGLPVVNSTYSILFCDLERWSTNRANTISLEDTFTISKPAGSSNTQVSSNFGFLPHNNITSVRFNGYSRFDID